MKQKRKMHRLVKGKTPIVEANESAKQNSLGKPKSNWLVIGIIALLSLGVLGAGLKYLEDDAKREMAKRESRKNNQLQKQEESLFNSINPFLPAPLPSPTPQLSKELIYSGQKLVAVEDANANAAPPFDIAIWRPSSGYWWVMGGNGSQQTSQGWGSNGDEPTEGDYDGDGKTDFCVFRPDSSNQTGTWYLMYSSSGGTAQIQYGLDTDKPAQADYDSDGKTDIAVFRNSNTTWYIYQSSTSSTVSVVFGSSGDTPIPADFDGDGKADVAVWRNSAATFYSKNSSDGQTITTGYGTSGDKPVCADYDGDGKADLSVWRTSNTTWYYRKSSDTNTVSYQWGIATDLPVQNDYDGDGKVDMALWRAVETYSGAGDVGRWYILQSTNSQIRQETWGISGDIPVPAFYRR